ncbi:MAG: peptidoglycan recognition family protein [Sedimentisphaerales bacterium]
MFKKILMFVIAAYLPTAAVLLIGCEGETSYTPRITGIVPELHEGSSHTEYKTPSTSHSYSSSSSYKTQSYKTYKSSSDPYGWAPSGNLERDWKAIVIHHSATDTGNVASIDDYHRRINGWDGIGYDFLIGNGSGCGNGEVDATFRWTGQKTGAHCKTDASNWANENAIGICLVGNFDQSKPSSAQMASLMKLVRFLSERYNIPASRIYGHNTTPGHSTNTSCPGRYFPMSYVKTHL